MRYNEENVTEYHKIQFNNRQTMINYAQKREVGIAQQTKKLMKTGVDIIHIKVR